MYIYIYMCVCSYIVLIAIVMIITIYGVCIRCIPRCLPYPFFEARLCFDNAEKSGLAQATGMISWEMPKKYGFLGNLWLIYG